MDELRKISYFIAVAEELHFGRAAARLHISQPPLSQQIKALESRLGVQLFERDRRSVRLTLAGRAYLQHAYDVLHAAAAAAAAARRAASGECGELRIGYSSSALYADAVLQAIVRFCKRRPSVDVCLIEGTTRSSVADLEANRIDVAFVRGPLPLPATHWNTERKRLVSRERLMVAMPRTHALATHRLLALEDLRDEAFVALSRDMGTALNELINGLLKPLAVQPLIAVETGDMASLLGLVSAGAGIALMPETVTRQRSRYIASRPLTDRGAQVELFQLLPQKPVPAALGLVEMDELRND
jgi:DNA-binding transcriptional LysR family regulator